MKQILLTAIVCILSAGPAKTYAQTVQTDNSNVVAGQFEINVGSGIRTNQVNVNYTIAPLQLTGKIKLELSSHDAILFNADISDASGSILKIWVPSARGNHYQDNIDISYLPAGEYYVNIHKDNSDAILYSIPFTKSI